MKVTMHQLKAIIREERARLREDAIDTELKNLKKNIANDLDHIKDLKDDVEDDHEEELRAEKEKRKDETRFAELAGLPALQEQANYKLERALSDMSYKLEEEINAAVAQATGEGQWWEMPEHVDAVMAMLDELKQTFGSFASNRG